MVKNKLNIQCVEICAGSLQSGINAKDGGAQRIEYCSHLEWGGLTPTYGGLRIARDLLDLEIFVLIRPRPGHFVFDKLEVDQMLEDIDICKSLGMDGIVTGALTPDQHVDLEISKRLKEMTDPLPCVFHRAIDDTDDPLLSMEQIITLGYQRILTSGGANSAWEGSSTIKQMVDQAAGRIQLLAGAGIKLSNIEQLVQKTGVNQVHTSASIEKKDQIKSTLFGNDQQPIKETSVELVKQFMMYL